MRSIILTFLCWYALISVKAQTNYIPYYQKWLKVESLALEDQMEAAEKLILECFDSHEAAFATDLVLAAQISAITGHDSLSFLWIEKALKRGVKYSCFKAMEVFKEMQSKPQWDTLQSKVKRLEYEYASAIRLDLNKEFMQRFYLEQEAKSKPTYEDVVTSNFNRIREITQSIGFPGERLVGLDISNDTESVRNCYYGNGKITVTFLHHPYAFSLLHKELLAAVKSGDLAPDDFLYIYSFERRKVSALYPKARKIALEIVDYDYLLGGKDLTDQEINQINAARFEFGLGPLKTQVDRDNRKAIFDRYGILVGGF
ncbi:MAG: hypothetical protein Sapg2KO_03290 [Saprospiraceae bacterium]